MGGRPTTDFRGGVLCLQAEEVAAVYMFFSGVSAQDDRYKTRLGIEDAGNQLIPPLYCQNSCKPRQLIQAPNDDAYFHISLLPRGKNMRLRRRNGHF